MDSLWQGPFPAGPQSGISYSMLHEFIVDRHDFFLHYVRGFDPEEGRFDPKLEFGSIFHEGLDGYFSNSTRTSPNKLMDKYANKMLKAYPADTELIKNTVLVAKRLLPVYVEYWKKKRAPAVVAEEVFEEHYELPTGETILLRGKFDGVIHDKNSVWLLETKTKGWVDEDHIAKSLVADLQTMLYCIVLAQRYGKKFKGFIYNVIRRPLGNQRAPQRRKAEDYPVFLDRVFRYYDGSALGYPIYDNQDYWFMRWKVDVTSKDLSEWRHTYIDRWLATLADWWMDVSPREDPFDSPLHLARPFGVFDYVMFRGSPFMDLVANVGGMAEEHWPRINRLWPELKTDD